MRRSILFAILAAAVTWSAWQSAPLAQPAAGDASLTDDILKGVTYRNLGPFRAGTWTNDIAVPDGPPRSHLYTLYIAPRYAGVWKSTNNGTTFTHVFNGETTSSIGCIAIAPSNENIVWVGTGDSTNVRVSMPGDGVYKSVDAGRTWQKMGLEATRRVARIVIHPTTPDIVYVAAMGTLWSPNEDRGVFKTTDGGKTWRKVLYVNDTTGVIDLVVNRRQPDTLYAATYQVQRYPWRLEEGGPGTGVHKTTNGGRTWTRVAGGFPQGPLGRIGLDLYQKDPDIVYAVVENLTRRAPTEAEAREDRARNRAPRERQVGGEVYRTEDGGRTWKRMNEATDDVSSKAGYSFNQIRVDQNNPEKIIINSDSLLSSEDGGRTWTGLDWARRDLFGSAFGDYRTMWIDPQDSNRMMMGSDGGLHVSYDGGRTVDHLANIPGGEFYAVAVDMDDPYHIYGGLQDHDSWRGPINGPSGRIGPEDWVTVGDNDGMYNQVDPTDSRWVYNSVQWGGHYRADMKTRTRTSIVPRRPDGEEPLRFNWTPPIRISPHNSQIIYTGAQVLLRSLDRGDHWEEISPDLTTGDRAKISPPGSTVQFCTITTLAASPITPGVIWVGTDDGKVQLTRNHGAAWTDVTGALAAAGGPADHWVTRVAASAHAPGTAYVTKSGMRFDKPDAFVFRTTDFGATWTPIHANLPPSPVNVLVEDPADRDLLFVGNNRGIFVTVDGGRVWRALSGNMPVVPVWDMVIHPREHDLVAGSFGRGLWVTNIAWLREVRSGALDQDVHVFAMRPTTQPQDGAWGNYHMYGDRHLYVDNEDGAIVTYFLKRKASERVTITIADASGRTVQTLRGPSEAGLNRARWNVRAGRAPAPHGRYTLTLETGGTTRTTALAIRPRVAGT